jgi:serine/threonine-protein kinase PpkA
MGIPGHEILRLIGQGGMATVYLAKQTSLGRDVVLKILDTTIADSKETIKRFVNEGRIVASLRHPHIITIYDIGTADDSIYISMEYVQGGDLKSRLERHVFAPDEAIDIISKLASALAAAHAQGIVHRDVKPGNVLFRDDATPLLSDFGIAKNVSADADLTRTGMFVGSPNYMAPEQAESGVIDRRADIYSLGVIFYEMLTGEKPYISDSVIDVIYKHKKGPIPKLPAGLEDYQDLLNLMMAKNRNDRFRDADSLLHYIRALQHRGMVKSMAELAKEPDFDVTGELDVPATARVTRVTLQPPTRSVKRFVLMALLALSFCIYGGLLVVERRMATSDMPGIAQAADQSALTLPEQSFADPIASDPITTAAAPGAAEVAVALAWLGRHSLDEYRLIAPPKDNAYYYFSRLRHMDPDNEDAREGLLAIAARYAILAETEIANDNFERARGYIAIGLQIDPHNEALAVLRDLTSQPEDGFLRALARLFGN